MNVSCLILTFNEEINIERCLLALDWCDDVVVLDSGSTDRTVEIARGVGARILSRPFDTFAGQRNFGLDQGAFVHEWVLHLDADEIVTPEFIARLEALAPSHGVDAYNVPSKMMLFGRWLRHAGMWPTYQVRIGHRDRLRFKQVGHGQREDLPAERVGIFPEPYLHFSFSHGMRRWLERHIRYAADEADLIIAEHEGRGGGDASGGRSSTRSGRRRKMKSISARLPVFLRPLARFFYMYVFRLGFRDGRNGFFYCFMMSVYEGMTAMLVYERRRKQ
jgi:glycosyltransferase involved in cell wall biosynthesis